MSEHPRSSLKSLTQPPTGPGIAEPAPATGGSGALKVVAEGVPSSLRPDPHPAADGRYIVAVLHICAPRGAVPTATSKCECGHTRSAVGQRQVLALIQLHTDHRTACPLGRTATHRRKAA
ncbi:hypothetical protein ABT024_12500 [Streptomyces sp. NPDC002812]|uniref:hypothetical protein n=1 Tax=Streptomyces sp. NPDC002812 TaxID=3154434 RepID=UPI0033347C4E